MAPLDVLAQCARCGLGFAGEAADCTRLTELVVLHTRFCPGDDRSGEVWAPYAAVYASLRREVLLVGGDPDARAALRVLLARAGHGVDEVDGGPGTVDAVVGRSPDVVIIDVGASDPDELDVARRIRAARGREAPLLVALTDGDGRRARAAGFDTWVSKPPPPDELERVMAAAPGMTLVRV